MQLFKQKSRGKTSNKKLNFKKTKFFSKKRFLPVAGIFGLVGGYLVYQSFAYTPLLAGANGEFVALAPSRIMDTRNGNGGYNAAIPTNGTYSLQVTGRGGVPAVTGVKSVVMSVAVVSPSANGYLTVWPSGVSKPNASNINFVAGQNIANQVTVPVGADGKVQFSSSASTHIIVDISGYYSSENGISGSRYNSLSPARILDTRNGTGGYTSPIANNGVYDVQVTGAGGVPISNVSAVVINIVAVSPTANGYSTVWPSGIARPDSSSLNYVSGKTIAKLVTVPIGANGKVSIFNSGSATNYIVDVAGYYSNDITPDTLKTQAGRFISVNPARVMDTRNNLGGYRVAIPANGTYSLTLKGKGGLPRNNSMRAVVVNITAVSPTANGFLTAWPSGVPKPNASNINFVKGQTTANQAIIKVGADGKIQFSSSVSTHIIVDVAGYFLEYEDDSSIAYTQTHLARADGTYFSKSFTDFRFKIGFGTFPTNIGDYPPFLDFGLSYDTSMRVNMVNGSGTISVSCYPYSVQQCEALMPGSTDETSNDFKSITIPYSVSQNSSYTVRYSVSADPSNSTKKWIATSMIDQAGTETQLLKRAFVSANPYEGWMSINTSVHASAYDCNQAVPSIITVGEYTVDGASAAAGNGIGYSKPDYQIGAGNCSGFANAVYDGLTASSPTFTMITLGVPKVSRDTVAPVISDFRYDRKFDGDYDVSKFVFIASDNAKIVSYGLKLDAVMNVRNNGYYDSSLNKDSFYSGLSSGSHTATLTVFDNSGNQTEKTITITIP